MYSLKEYREPTGQLVDALPWALLEAPGVVRLKSGALMRSLSYRGHDPEILTNEERVVLSGYLNEALMQLGSGWTMFSEIRRVRGHAYPYTQLEPGIAQVVEEIRRETFGKAGELFETTYVLTLVWSPSQSAGKKLMERALAFLGGLFEGGEQAVDLKDIETKRREELEVFMRHTRDVAAQLRGMCASLHWLDDTEMLEWLHGTISTHRHPIRPPDTPMYIDALLADEPIQCGTEMKIGREHVRVISVKHYPNHSHPHLLGALETLPVEMRLCSRFICLSKEESIKHVEKYQKMLEAQAEKANPFVKQGSAQAVDSWIIEQAEEARQGVMAIKRGEVTFGHHSLQIVVHHADYQTCRQRAEEVMTILRHQGFGCVEETANLKGAWLSTLPGHLWANPRRAIISSQNMSHMLCTQAVWMGDREQTHPRFEGMAHVICRTSGGTPFYMNLNVRDVGHTTVFGPTGAGKSTLLVTLIMQWLKYEGAQVFAFDKGRSARACTLAAQGTFLELSVDHPQITFQPLGRINEPREFEFALTWLEEVATLEGVQVGIEERKALRLALESLKHTPKHLRTITGLTLALQHRTLRAAFEPYCDGPQGEGVYAPLWNSDEERLGLSHVTTIEMEELMGSNARLIAMTLRYLFHRIEERLTGPPTLLVLDEAWLFLSHPMFVPRIKEWLKVLRKKNTYVVFATQDISDALSSEIAPTLLQNCPTQILLSNSKAMQSEIYASYKKLGLSHGQIQAIATMKPHGVDRPYYLHNALGSRVFYLGLSALELALAENSTVAHERMDLALRQARQTGVPWVVFYLELSGFHTMAERLRQNMSRARPGSSLHVLGGHIS